MSHISLIAYIPVLNQRHLDWFKKHPDAPGLYLISQELAESLVPRLARNIGAIPTSTMMTLSYQVRVGWTEPLKGQFRMAGKDGQHYILPDEDVSHIFAEKHIEPEATVTFESIWARYDMSAVNRRSPVMNVPITTGAEHQLRMERCKDATRESPDWWRQIGACIVTGTGLHISACNEHYPTEYVTDIMGDPRLTVDAGQVGKYVSFHAEKTTIAKAAQSGICTNGAVLYTTVFPCEDCARAIVIAGIRTVFFEEGYSALDALEVLQGAGVEIIQVKSSESA